MATPDTSQQQPPPPRSGYQEVDWIRDPDGILVIISRRLGGPPIHSVSVFKVFMRDGVSEKSTFWSPNLYEAVLRALSIAIPRARELEATAMAEYGSRR